MKNLWMDRCLFENPYHLTLCTTEKQYRRELKRLNIPKDQWPSFVMTTHANSTIHYFQNGSVGLAAIVCLYVDKTKTIHQINALLVHESVHLWQAVKESIGEKNPSPEFEAYAIQSMAQCLMVEFERQTK